VLRIIGPCVYCPRALLMPTQRLARRSPCRCTRRASKPAEFSMHILRPSSKTGGSFQTAKLSSRCDGYHGQDRSRHIPGCKTKDGEYVSNGEKAVAAPQWMYNVIAAAKTRSNASRAEGFDDPVAVEMFKQMLDATPYTGGPAGLDNRSDDQNGWFNHMAAVHDASGGDNGEYRDLYIEWCLNDPNGKDTWTAETNIPRWDSLEPLEPFPLASPARFSRSLQEPG
jgi:hypothetical protein